MAAKKINATNGGGKGDSSKTFSFSSTAANSDIKVAADVNKGLRQTGVKSRGESGGKSGGKSSASSTGRSDDLTLQAMLYMGLLAIQFAVQPVFSAKYKPGPGIDKTLVVMCTGERTMTERTTTESTTTERPMTAKTRHGVCE